MRKPLMPALALSLVSLLLPSAFAQSMTLPGAQRPEWLARDGIVMAGSWEPLMFRVRRDGSEGYDPTPEQRAAYAREHSPEMVARLKELGVNFVMMHCYKGAGLKAEGESMADAVAFAKLCHEAGMRVGVYTYSGAFLWEPFFEEVPEAREWVILEADGSPQTYGSAKYRYYWNRNHPDAQAFYKQIVRFAVEDIQTDLLHFDNYHEGPGYDACSIRLFREYLGATFGEDELRGMDAGDLSAVMPPAPDAPDSMLRRAWLDYTCKALADSYYEMGGYGRSLRGDVLVECNPGGVGGAIRPPVDHSRLLQGGEAYWDESLRPGFHDGRLVTRIRTFKVARRMNNTAFNYTTSPLEAAEAMAFNQDCLGCVCWFEYADVVERPGFDTPMSPALQPYIRFFHARRDVLAGADVVADAAVLRSFPSQVFGDVENAQITQRVEEALITSPACFQIIYDTQLGELERYRVLVLAGCVAMADAQVTQVRDFIAQGGKLCIVGPVATHDEWMRPRPVPALGNLPATNVTRVESPEETVAALATACDGTPTLTVSSPHDMTGLCAEVTEQPERRLVHLVNYRGEAPANDIRVVLRLPEGRKAREVSLASPDHAADAMLEYEASDAAVSFTVPQVGTYEIAVVELQ